MRVDQRFRGLAFFVLLILCSITVQATTEGNPFKHSAGVGERFLDLRSYLFKIAERYDWSLIVAQDVRSSVKQVKGKTVRDAINNYLANTEFSYELDGNCLYVAEKHRLSKFFEKLSEDAIILPRGKGSVDINGVFNGIDISIFCKMLRGFTGVEIRSADNLKANLMMRLVKMPWKTLVVAIVRLNDFKLHRSEFSVIIDERGI